MDLLASGIDALVWLGGAAILTIVGVTWAVVAVRRRLDLLGEELKDLRKLGISPALDGAQALSTTGSR